MFAPGSFSWLSFLKTSRWLSVGQLCCQVLPQRHRWLNYSCQSLTSLIFVCYLLNHTQALICEHFLNILGQERFLHMAVSAKLWSPKSVCLFSIADKEFNTYAVHDWKWLAFCMRTKNYIKSWQLKFLKAQMRNLILHTCIFYTMKQEIIC